MLLKSHKLLNIRGGGIRTFGQWKGKLQKTGMGGENNVVFLNC